MSKPTSDQTASSSVAAIPSGRVSDDDAKRYLDEIDKLKFLVTHRDNEISKNKKLGELVGGGGGGL